MRDATGGNGQPDAEGRLARLKQRSGYCGLCCCIIRDFTGHKCRRPACKTHQDSRVLSDEVWRASEAEFWEEQVDPNAVKRRRVDSAKERHAKKWEPPAEGQAAESAEYRMTFGKYSAGKGKTVAEVLAVDSNDSEHLTSWKNNVQEPHPDLRDAVDKASLLSLLSERRPSLQRARAEKIFAQASDTLARRGHTRTMRWLSSLQKYPPNESGEARFCAQGPRRAQKQSSILFGAHRQKKVGQPTRRFQEAAVRARCVYPVAGPLEWRGPCPFPFCHLSSRRLLG